MLNTWPLERARKTRRRSIVVKRVFLVILVTAMLFTFAGCSTRNQINDDSTASKDVNAAPQELKLFMAEGYTFSGKCNEITPYGSAVLENSVIICDMGNNCLREFDFQGNGLVTGRNNADMYK